MSKDRTSAQLKIPFASRATALLARVQHVFMKYGPSTVNRTYLLTSKADKKGTIEQMKVTLLPLSDTSTQPTTSSNMLPSSSDYDEYFVYPEDTQSFECGTELPSKLDSMDGLRALEFESSTALTVLWSSDGCDLYLEDTDNAYIENFPLHPTQTPDVTRHRYIGSSTGDFLGVPQLSPDESPYSVASSSSPLLTPEGGTLLLDIFCSSSGDFVSPDVTIGCSPSFEQEEFVEDTVCPEQLQDDLTRKADWNIPSSVSLSRSVSDPSVILQVDDPALVDDQSSILSDPVVSHHSSMERSHLLHSSEDLTGDMIPQVPPCLSPSPSTCHPVQEQPSSPSISQRLATAPAEIRRGIKRRRIDDSDEEYQPHRTYKHRRALSSQARPNTPVVTRKHRRGGPRSSKRTTKCEEAPDERFECLMLIHGCMKSFTRKNDMERHLGSCKFNPDLRSVTVDCPHCQKTLSRKDALLRHLKQSHAEDH